VDFVHDQQRSQENRGASCGEGAQEDGDRPLIGEIADDFDLERVVWMVSDDPVGDIANDRIHCLIAEFSSRWRWGRGRSAEEDDCTRGMKRGVTV
jgi:hypothetical protein